jgi:hypothetical protein
MYRLQWRVILRTASGEKALALLLRIQEALAVPLEGSEYHLYWKDPSLHEASCEIRLDDVENATVAVYQTLILAGKLGIGWTVGTPQQFQSGEFEFHGHKAADFRVNGLDWASFSLSGRSVL